MDGSLIAAVATLLLALGVAAASRWPPSRRAALAAVGLLPLVVWVLLRPPPEAGGGVRGPAPADPGRPEAGSAPGGPREGARPPGERARPRVLRSPERPLEPGESPVPEESLAEKRTPIRLFGSARVIPRYQGGVMLGVGVADVRPGSFWELIGLESGDLVFESNGRLVDDPEASIEFMNALSRDDALRIWVRGADGRDRYLVYDVPSAAAEAFPTAPPAAPAPRERGPAG